MLKIISLKKFRKIIREQYNNGYDKGLSKGYELGFMMGQVASRNRPFIKRSKVEWEIEDIINNF